MNYNRCEIDLCHNEVCKTGSRVCLKHVPNRCEWVDEQCTNQRRTPGKLCIQHRKIANGEAFLGTQYHLTGSMFKGVQNLSNCEFMRKGFFLMENVLCEELVEELTRIHSLVLPGERDGKPVHTSNGCRSVGLLYAGQDASESEGIVEQAGDGILSYRLSQLDSKIFHRAKKSVAKLVTRDVSDTSGDAAMLSFSSQGKAQE